MGIVQHAYPISLTGDRPSDEKILVDHAESCAKFADQGVQLIVWPETTLPEGLNREVRTMDFSTLSSQELRSLAHRFFGEQAWDQQYSDAVILANLVSAIDPAEKARGAEAVGAMSRAAGCPILAGGATIHRNPYPPVDRNDFWITRNSAVLFDRSAVPRETYSKMHLVPFGEYVRSSDLGRGCTDSSGHSFPP